MEEFKEFLHPSYEEFKKFISEENKKKVEEMNKICVTTKYFTTANDARRELFRKIAIETTERFIVELGEQLQMAIQNEIVLSVKSAFKVFIWDYAMQQNEAAKFL